MYAILRPRVRTKLKDTLLPSVIQLHLELERGVNYGLEVSPACYFLKSLTADLQVPNPLSM